MSYSHTQRGPWFLLMAVVATACLVVAWVARGAPLAVVACGGVAFVMLLCALSFVHLTVYDDVDALAVRYGPLPLFAWLCPRIRYDEIKSIEPDRSNILDGWGVHWFPGRGTTYNIWGRDCVRIETGRRIYRIGSDDVDNLISFLRQRIDNKR